MTCEMIALAAVADGTGTDDIDLIVDGLFTTVTDVNFDAARVALYRKGKHHTVMASKSSAGSRTV